ncbi:LLM class flavin-dependent oxidoreductase [Actinoplanes sp. NPDC023714]|uniref:LLM class flavin-dependent oxidoreductase n=1 Tax=Actinoplanes sp. NPDC023714 TaxID=3154322 RepID=UPI0033CEF0A9
MRLSLLVPFAPAHPREVAGFAKLVRPGGAARLWQGQGLLLDAHQVVTWLAGNGLPVPAGFGVSLMPLRSPAQAAVDARSVALTTGQPVVAGFGPGSAELQRGLLGGAYPRPLAVARDYLGAVRATLTGAPFPVEVPPVEIGLGVLRPGMARVAGEVADVAITWLTPASYLERTLWPALRSAPRALPEPIRVTAIVPVALDGPGRDPAALVTAACGAHVRAPHYRDMLRQAGVDEPDPHRLIDEGVFLYGSAADIRKRLDEFAAAGVDEVVLNATGTAAVHGPRAAAGDLLALLKS